MKDYVLRDLTPEETKGILESTAVLVTDLRRAILRADPTFDFETMKWTHERQREAKHGN